MGEFYNVNDALYYLTNSNFYTVRNSSQLILSEPLFNILHIPDINRSKSPDAQSCIFMYNVIPPSAPAPAPVPAPVSTPVSNLLDGYEQQIPIAIGGDGKMIWFCRKNTIAAYDPEKDNWYGTVSSNDVSSACEIVFIDDEVWLLGYNQPWSVKKQSFLNKMIEMGLSKTTAEFRKEYLELIRTFGPEYEGVYYVSKKDYEKAIRCFDDSIRLEPNNVLPYFRKAVCLRSLNPARFDEAIKIYDEIIKKFDSSAIRRIAESEKLGALFYAKRYEEVIDFGSDISNYRFFSSTLEYPVKACLELKRPDMAKAIIDKYETTLLAASKYAFVKRVSIDQWQFRNLDKDDISELKGMISK